MKKIILSIIISSLSFGAIAQGVFNTQIPQPDFVSNDWDGDGIINSLDDDDDNDGDKDFEDSTPFGGLPGGSQTTPSILEKSVTLTSNYQRFISPDLYLYGYHSGGELDEYNLSDDITITGLYSRRETVGSRTDTSIRLSCPADKYSFTTLVLNDNEYEIDISGINCSSTLRAEYFRDFTVNDKFTVKWTLK